MFGCPRNRVNITRRAAVHLGQAAFDCHRRGVDQRGLLVSAERVIDLERMINARFGFTRADDTLPKRLLTEPATDGRGEGQVVDLDKALDRFYEAMGWDLETGLPTDETLERLGLASAV